MIKYLLVASGIFFLEGCGTTKPETTSTNSQNQNTNKTVADYAESITKDELSTYLYTFAGDDFEGRDTGEPGQKKAAEYLKTQYLKLGIPSPLPDSNYYQPIPASFFKAGIKASENVLAYIEGTDKKEEIIVLSAHYDHVGMDTEGNVFNGADDDGSGTVSLLEIAQAFAKAKEEGKGPRRSLLFLHVTGEEKGLYGSKYYTENPIFPLTNTVANLNIDMIGRMDDLHPDDENYVYLIGSDKLSSELHSISEAQNKKFVQLDLDYRFNDENDPNRFYYRSDHYNFAKENIPIIFYFNGVHADYHKITDTPDKINYKLLEKRAKLVFYTAWELANREDRIVVDSNKK